MTWRNAACAWCGIGVSLPTSRCHQQYHQSRYHGPMWNTWWVQVFTLCLGKKRTENAKFNFNFTWAKPKIPRTVISATCHFSHRILASCRNTLRSQPIAHSDPSSRFHCHLQGESLPKTRPQDSLPSNMAESTNNDYTNSGCSMIPRPKLNASCGRGMSCVLPKLHSTHFTTRNIPYHMNGQAAQASTCLVNSFTNIPTYLLFNPLL